jgi:hypothetical protein
MTNHIDCDNQYEDDGRVTCPVCRGSYLHHFTVTERTGEVAIQFWCEDCPAIMELALQQCKGNSYLRWRSVTTRQPIAIFVSSKSN